MAAPTAVALIALACDVPTSLPKWDTVWVVPVETTSLAIADLVPSSVDLTRDGTAFLVDVPETPVSLSLDEICPPCVSLDGQTAPKPAVHTSFGADLALPPGIVSVTVGGGRMIIATTNGLSFDPIRPGRRARGWWSATILADQNRADPLATDTIDGTRTAMPPGHTRTDTFRLDEATLSELTLEYTIDSPAGDPVRINTSNAMTVEVAAEAVRASELVVTFPPQAVTTPAVEIDLSDVDGPILEHVRSGALLLEVQNPFELEAEVELVIEAAGTTIRETTHFEPGTSRPRVELTGEEIRALLAAPAQYRLDLVLSSPSGTLALRPSQVLEVDTRLEVVVGPER